MISLNGLELNPSLNWVERFQSSSIAQSANHTLGGRVVIQQAPLYGGGPVTLVATEDTGWLTWTMVQQLIAMSDMQGAMFFLTYHDTLVNVPVMFRHNEPPALDLEPLVRKETYLSDDYFIGSVKLIRV